MFDSWLTLSGFGMDLQQVSRDLHPDAPASGGAWGRPAKFVTHRDALGRFSLEYPSGWELNATDGVLVRSKRLSSYAKVDLFPIAESSWATLQDAIAKAGGSLTILKEIAGTPSQLRGHLEIGGTRFDLHAWAYSQGTESIVLSCGVDSGANPPFKKYAAQVMSAIHRQFKVQAV